MEAEDEDGDSHDGVGTSSPVFCVDGSHEMGGYLLQCNGNSERNIEVLSREVMACGYKRQVVRSDGRAAMVSTVRLSILATMADGPYTDVEGQSSENALAEGAVKEVNANIRTFQYDLERGLNRTVLENQATLAWLVQHAEATIN